MNTLFPYTVLFRAVERAGAQFAAQTQQRRRRLEQIGRRTNHLGYARVAVEDAGETSLRQPADPGLRPALTQSIEHRSREHDVAQRRNPPDPAARRETGRAACPESVSQSV